LAPSSSVFSDPIEKISVVDQLAAKIRQRILRNEIRAGAQLRQEALAKAYGVSRMPIREALRQLEAEGLVVFNPHRGVIVSAMSIDEASELFDLRLLIEPDLLVRATRAATPDDHAVAREALDRMNRAYEDAETEHWGELNGAYHICLYRPAGRSRSETLIQTLNANIDRYVRLQLSLEPGALDRARDEHERLHALYAAGEAEEAATLLRQHISNARDTLIAKLHQRPEFSD
jgi:DNA-binding GntR family transcriptional regulator